MALELLKSDYGDINDDDEVEESSLSANEENGEISNLRIFEKELAQEGVQEEMGIAQMTNERVRGNVMALELAIQREFEFRTKIERLKLGSPRCDLEEPQIAVQGSPSNIELGEIDGASASDNVSCLQGGMSDLLFFERKLAWDRDREEISMAQKTNEKVTRKVMSSVELAIQMDLEYQAKIKRLQSQSHNDSKEAPIGIQGSPPDLEVEKMNRDSHSDNVSCSQGRISDPMFFKRVLEVVISEAEITRRERNDERVKRNVMPVELAIQRELAYRRKLKNLQCQPSIKFQEPAILFQGSSSNLRTGLKRKAPSGNLTCSFTQKLPRLYTQPSPEIKPVKLFCRVCQLVCLNEFTLKRHYEGNRHKERLQELRKGRELVCEVCSVSFLCTDIISFQNHLDGKKHAAACVQGIGFAAAVRDKRAGEVPFSK